ncbi:glycosyltransferase [Limimaricola pyoseonensis]|uniref:Glycosyltransferase involved in cell wall bisynthesis n=1 Tax=Limimaricola pyoseonensis TaxID=521013 RepID=A0A1G7IZM2_9RHOB|nr:glycosyltransferase [Limimaricola pyoseonensis]SDF18004.1 Glycosyltransferase involved in cell wall bisynthesis [Limimaricola pyoseonensis]
MSDTNAASDRAVLVVGRRLDDLRSGNGQYLVAYLEACRRAGWRSRLLFAPRRAFGNLAWARVAPEIAALVEGVDWPGAVRIGGLYVSTAPVVWARMARRLWREAAGRLRGRRQRAPPSLLGAELDPREAAETADWLRRRPAGLLTAEYSSLAPLLDGQGAARRAVLLHDLFALRAESFAARGLPPDHAAPSLAEEAGRCRAATLLIHASRVEEARLRPLLPQAEHVWLPPAIPRDGASPTLRDRIAPPAALFLGTDHAGNRAALELLRRRVWPGVRRQRPEAVLRVAGSIAAALSPAEAAAEGIEPLGPVADLATLGGPDAIGLAPMELRSGVPIKVVDYLALGMPVVASAGTLDAFGPALDGLVIEAADDADYAAVVARLLSDPRERRCRAAAAAQLAGRLSPEGLVAALRR